MPFELVQGGLATHENSALSANDKRFVRKMYPKAKVAPVFENYAPLIKDAGAEHLVHSRAGQMYVWRSKAAFDGDQYGLKRRFTMLKSEVSQHVPRKPTTEKPK